MISVVYLYTRGFGRGRRNSISERHNRNGMILIIIIIIIIMIIIIYYCNIIYTFLHINSLRPILWSSAFDGANELFVAGVYMASWMRRRLCTTKYIIIYTYVCITPRPYYYVYASCPCHIYIYIYNVHTYMHASMCLILLSIVIHADAFWLIKTDKLFNCLIHDVVHNIFVKIYLRYNRELLRLQCFTPLWYYNKLQLILIFIFW